jgi:hypothetical protein
MKISELKAQATELSSKYHVQTFYDGSWTSDSDERAASVQLYAPQDCVFVENEAHSLYIEIYSSEHRQYRKKLLELIVEALEQGVSKCPELASCEWCNS